MVKNNKENNRKKANSRQESVIKTNTFIFPDGSTYEGDYKESENGKIVRSGHGKFVSLSNQSTYEGEWVNDEINGKGKIEYANGNSYEGDWLNNKYNGTGTYRWSDGSYYIGEWLENKMNGPGKYYDKNKEVWIGLFINGKSDSLVNEI
ncbi:histone H3 K4-specific methyltransferase SET7/9 N-terminal domain-containing protein [Piromyces finnis]|uniref:Histone H3 K4-specific methyltransferase SET7/9 N-terminal domain-containing protein n=1 Tax=Piromyces finnis TaxID=1754191 RepID=A0A1Y1VFV5_9FUNG|nr:histone H3 K4-specific methyltransferase SET7/9 N-terminal domain-containing protein [Piromyces finnis]|eukprot:ORX55307.1 histone H3 K4-specific methyltransferase SET7/9 N-terminal domain-containing protein [Piromyces finnis]